MYIHMNEYQTRSTYDSVYLNKLSDNLMRSPRAEASIYQLHPDRGPIRARQPVQDRLDRHLCTGHQFRSDMAEYDYQSAATPGAYIVQNLSRIWQHNTDQVHCRLPEPVLTRGSPVRKWKSAQGGCTGTRAGIIIIMTTP